MHPLPTRRTSVLLLACTCASAWAQDTPPIEVTAAYTVDSDDIQKAELGLLFHTTQGLQKFELDARLANYRYQETPEQNHTETNYTAGWQWAVTPRLRGHLNASRQEAPKVDYGYGDPDVPNRQTRKHYRADAEYEVDGPWHVVAGLNRDENTSQDPSASNPDSRSDSRDVGVRYDSAKGSWVKASLKSTDGRYLTVDNASNDDFKQNEQELRVHWSLSAASSLGLYLTQIQRTHEGKSQIDFDGRNYGLNASWAVTGRSTLVMGYAHALSVALVPVRGSDPVMGNTLKMNSYLTEQDTLSLGWNWQTSSRTQVRVRQAWQRLDYISPPNADYAGYQTRSRDTSLNLVWTPGTQWQISTLLQRQTRDATGGGSDDSRNLVSVTAQFSF
jgi:hypothetical protein